MFFFVLGEKGILSVKNIFSLFLSLTSFSCFTLDVVIVNVCFLRKLHPRYIFIMCVVHYTVECMAVLMMTMKRMLVSRYGVTWLGFYLASSYHSHRIPFLFSCLASPYTFPAASLQLSSKRPASFFLGFLSACMCEHVSSCAILTKGSEEAEELRVGRLSCAITS